MNTKEALWSSTSWVVGMSNRNEKASAPEVVVARTVKSLPEGGTDGSASTMKEGSR